MKIITTAITCLVVGGVAGYVTNHLLSPVANIDVSGQQDFILQRDKVIVDLHKQVDVEKAKVASLINDVYKLQLRVSETNDIQGALQGKGAVELFIFLQSAQKHLNEGDQYLVDLIHQKLYSLLQEEQVSMDEALRELANNAGTPIGDLLADVLISTKDYRVEAAAQQLISAANPKEQRIAGFEILTMMHSKNPVTRESILQILSLEQDPDIISAAMYALTPSTVSDSQQQAIIDTLTHLTDSADNKIRVQSSIALAAWAISEDDLQAVINKTQDTSKNVRAEAAFALGMSKLKTGKSKQALIALVNNDSEDFEVRQNAWHSLKEYPLVESDILSYRELKNELEDNEY